jgi:hypothetical protein
MHQDDQGQPSLRSKIVLRGERRAVVAVVVSTGGRHDASYPFKTTGAAEGPAITGFPEKAMDRFSTRRAQITKIALALADQYGKDRRHAPDERALASMRRFANAMTRRAKEPGALNLTALLRGWEPAPRVAELGTLRGPARTIWHAAPRASAPSGARGDARAELAQTAARLAPRGELTRADFGQLQTQLHAGAAGG